jgi:hypothetical protein
VKKTLVEATFRFACSPCGHDEIEIAVKPEDDSRVTCAKCGRDLCSYAELEAKKKQDAVDKIREEFLRAVNRHQFF